MHSIIQLNPRYEVEPVRMSESPASRTAIVEQRYSFPHAVPSSICFIISQLTLQSPTEASSLGLIFLRLTLLPAKWWTLVFDSIE